jgi:PAS domain-containing protein
MDDHMATKAHQSVDADRVARGKDEKSGWRHVAAVADSSGDVITITPTVDGVIQTWKQSAERLDGYAQAA